MIYRFNQFELDEERRELREGGKHVSLQPLVFDMLALLVRNHRRVVQKQELLDALWPDGFVMEASLQRAVSLARSALNDSAHETIRTFLGRGYRFCANVDEVDQARSDRAYVPGAGGEDLLEPRIQYAKTSDDVSIAFWALGTGAPLVHMSVLFSHIQLEWEIPECRHWYERLAKRHRLIRYDGRALGLSEHGNDFSIEAWDRDLEAVVDRLGLQRFALLGLSHGGAAAIHYTANHPERVSHLILWHSYSSAVELLHSPRMRTIRAALNQDWDTYTELNAHMFLGWSAGEQARRYASLIRQSAEREHVLKIVAELNRFDVSALLSAIKPPTLVLQRRDFPFLDVAVARNLASRIPDSRLALLEGNSGAPYLGNAEAVAAAIDDFVNQGMASVGAELPSGTAVILFADIADSTGLTERLGDTAFRAKARELDGALRGVIRKHAGTAIEGKLLGDGVLAVFTSARQAIKAALVCATAGGDAGLPLHLGLHAGDVIREDNNVYGGAVNIAARISGLSAAGEVLVSETVRSLARTSAGVQFEDRGEQALKGVGEAVRVWAIIGDAN